MWNINHVIPGCPVKAYDSYQIKVEGGKGDAPGSDCVTA